MLVTTEGCDFEIDRGPDWLFVRVRNLDPDCPRCAALADRIWALLEQHLTYRVVLELDDLKMLSATMLDELAQLQERVRQHGGVIRLSGVSARGRRSLRARHMHDPLCTYGNRMAAVMGMPGQPR